MTNFGSKLMNLELEMMSNKLHHVMEELPMMRRLIEIRDGPNRGLERDNIKWNEGIKKSH